MNEENKRTKVDFQIVKIRMPNKFLMIIYSLDSSGGIAQYFCFVSRFIVNKQKLTFLLKIKRALAK